MSTFPYHRLKEVTIKALISIPRLVCSLVVAQVTIATAVLAQDPEPTEASASAAAPEVEESQERNAPDRWKVSAEFSFTDQSGNRVLRLLTGGLNVSHLQRDNFRLDASFQSRYGRTEGELVTLNHSASFAFDFRPTSAWSPFVFADAERDQFKRLDVRLSTGAGAKRTFRHASGGAQETSVSLALLHAFEQVAPRPPDDPLELPAPVERSHLARWSFRARTGHQLRDGITLRHTTFFQPIWGDMADYLLRSDTGLKILLTERLALSMEYQFKRDARPPEDVGPNDRLLTTGIIIDF